MTHLKPTLLRMFTSSPKQTRRFRSKVSDSFRSTINLTFQIRCFEFCPLIFQSIKPQSEGYTSDTERKDEIGTRNLRFLLCCGHTLLLFFFFFKVFPHRREIAFFQVSDLGTVCLIDDDYSLSVGYALFDTPIKPTRNEVLNSQVGVLPKPLTSSS